MINEPISVPGYQRVLPGELQLHTRFVAHHRGRIWVVRCSAKNDMAALEPLENEQSCRPFELFVLGCGVLLQDALARIFHAAAQTRLEVIDCCIKREVRQELPGFSADS